MTTQKKSVSPFETATQGVLPNEKKNTKEAEKNVADETQKTQEKIMTVRETWNTDGIRGY